MPYWMNDTYWALVNGSTVPCVNVNDIQGIWVFLALQTLQCIAILYICIKIRRRRRIE